MQLSELKIDQGRNNYGNPRKESRLNQLKINRRVIFKSKIAKITI